MIVWRKCCWLSSSSSILCMPRFNSPTSSFDSLKCCPSHTWWSVVDWLSTLREDTVSSSSSNHAVVMVGLRDIQTLGSPNMAAEWFQPKLCITGSVAKSFIHPHREYCCLFDSGYTAYEAHVAVRQRDVLFYLMYVTIRGPPIVESTLRSAYCQSVCLAQVCNLHWRFTSVIILNRRCKAF